MNTTQPETKRRPPGRPPGTGLLTNATHLSFTIGDVQKERLTQYARNKGVSVSQVIRDAIENLLYHHDDK